METISLIIEKLNTENRSRLNLHELIKDFFGKLEMIEIKPQLINENIYLIYKELRICKLRFGDHSSLKVQLEKVKKNESPSINERSNYFKVYWAEHLEKISCDLENENEMKILIFGLENLIEVFFKDLTVKFRLNQITFDNYRAFEKEIITFDEKFTVLIGKNSSGKTTILDAAAVSIGAFLSGIDEPTDSKTISKDDIRFSAKELEGVKVINYHAPTKVSFNTDFINNRYIWSRTRNSLNSTKLTTKDSNKIVIPVRYLVNEIRNNDSRKITLPVFSYHGTGRVANFTKDMKILEKTENISRFVGYKDCLKPASNYKFFVAWYTKMQYRAFTLNKRIPTLDAVTESLQMALTLLTEGEEKKIKRVLYLEGSLHIEYDDSEIMPISFLSDGYRDVIGIVSDIAYRMAILNPHLGKDVLCKTNGLVLIDEIDVHLHPKWQQKILGLLKSLFPEVQFIVTTHSPIIVSTTKKNEAQEINFRNNDDIDKITAIGEPGEWYISDILNNVFDLHQESSIKNNDSSARDISIELELFSEKVKDYLVSHNASTLEQVHQLYSQLITILSVNSPQRRAVDNLMRLVK